MNTNIMPNIHLCLAGAFVVHPVSGPMLTPTDGMIVVGTQRLFKHADLCINEYVQISEELGAQHLPLKEPTHIVVLGTPWLWDKCWKSIKYDNLRILLRAYPDAKRLFLGIGSCYPLGHELVVMNDIMANEEELDIFHNAVIITRDSLALNTLKHVPGSRSITSLPCPAYWALEDVTKDPNMQAMIWYDPTVGLSRSSFKPGSELNLQSWTRLKNYRNVFTREYIRTKNKVFCVNEEEIPGALLAGLPEPIVIENINHAKNILASASKIFSGRVHLAVPAFIHCPDVQLVQVDSRAKTLTDVQHGIILLNNALERYTAILKDFVL